jgi:hypothetical protein
MAELYDSASGRDRMQLTNSMVKEDEAHAIASQWARIPRKALDKAHGIGSR